MPDAIDPGKPQPIPRIMDKLNRIPLKRMKRYEKRLPRKAGRK